MTTLLDISVFNWATLLGNLPSTALLGFIIYGLLRNRKELMDEIEDLRKENSKLQASAVEKAETVTEKLVSALNATERQFERSAEASSTTNALLQQVLNKL